MSGMIENNRRKANIEASKEFLDECIAKGFDPVFFTVVATGIRNSNGRHVALVESDSIPPELEGQWCSLTLAKIGDKEIPVSENYRPIWRKL